MSAQPELLPLGVDELLGKDHEVFGLWELVERVLGDSLRQMAKDRGGYLHDPARMFCVWMYGFMQGRSSSRQLEDACKYDVRFAYLAGGTKPDHSTLSRFRERFGDVLPELMTQVCKQAQQSGLVGARPVMVDGTKLPGVSSQWNKALHNAAKEDCKLIKGPHGYVLGYNAQVAVDADSTYVVATVMSSNAADNDQLAEVMEEAKRTTGEYPSEVVADGGYDGGLNYQALEERGVVSYIHPRDEHVRVFEPDDSGVLRCKAGHVPTLRRVNKDGKPYDVYQVSHCRSCSFREDCRVGEKSHQKEMAIRAGTRLGAREENETRAKSERGQELLKKRRKTVELVFARLKAGMRFTRFKLRNLKGAGHEFRLLSTAYNLKLLLKWFLELLFSRTHENPIRFINILLVMKRIWQPQAKAT